MSGFSAGTSQTVSSKHVLIMDEVDGMAGNEDRGGIQVGAANSFIQIDRREILTL